MRTALRLLPLLLLVVLLAPGLAAAQAGRLLFISGEVAVLRGAQEIAAAAGTPVQVGDTLRVGARSSAQLRMSDESIVALRSNSVFRIDEYLYSDKPEESRSIFSLIKGGLRTVSGAIARPPAEGFVRTAAPAQAPAAAEPATAEKRPPAEESKLLGLIKAPLRTVAGALTPTRHAVRLPTATIGIRGTHYTVVHCDNDCYSGAPGASPLAPNGSYGGISDGRIGVVNNAADREFGAQEFFYVASPDSPAQGLIAPPGFLYDRLEAQERARGRTSAESTETMAQSGLNAESRPSETPLPPAPESFIVTEQRNASGDPQVLASAAPDTAFLSAFASKSGGPNTVGAFVGASALAKVDNGDGTVLLTAFNAGSYSGGAASVQDQSVPNALGAYWGVWFDGSATDASGTTIFSSLDHFHYLVGPNTPPEVIAAKSGSFGFDLVAGTLSVSNNAGDAGSMTGTRFTVDFTARNVAFPATSFAFSPSGQNWNFSAPSPAPIMIQSGRGAFVESTATGTCAGGTCTTLSNATLSRTAIFMGPAGDHLGVAFQGRTTGGTGSGSMQGTAIFACTPGPC